MVYLLHFSLPYPRDARGWTQHYIGFTVNMRNRLGYHLSGHGSPFLAAVARSGRTVVVVRKWKEGGRWWEKRLKSQANAVRLCPVCSGRGAYRRARVVDNGQLPLALLSEVKKNRRRQ